MNDWERRYRLSSPPSRLERWMARHYWPWAIVSAGLVGLAVGFAFGFSGSLWWPLALIQSGLWAVASFTIRATALRRVRAYERAKEASRSSRPSS